MLLQADVIDDKAEGSPVFVLDKWGSKLVGKAELDVAGDAVVQAASKCATAVDFR